MYRVTTNTPDQRLRITCLRIPNSPASPGIELPFRPEAFPTIAVLSIGVAPDAIRRLCVVSKGIGCPPIGIVRQRKRNVLLHVSMVCLIHGSAAAQLGVAARHTVFHQPANAYRNGGLSDLNNSGQWRD